MSCHLISNLVTHNPLVVGSSPTGPTILKAAHCAAFVFLDGPPQIQSESPRPVPRAEAPRPNVSNTDALDVLLSGSWLAGDEPHADVKFPGASHQRLFAS